MKSNCIFLSSVETSRRQSRFQKANHTTALAIGKYGLAESKRAVADTLDK
jgi:hypothetical protein